MIWDTDLVWVEGIRMVLEKRGISCVEADDKKELLESIFNDPVLCILSKDTLDENSSTFGEILSEYKETLDIPFLLVLEEDDILSELSALQSGADDVLIKRKGMEIAAARIGTVMKRNLKNFYENIPFNENNIENSQILLEQYFSGIQFTPMERKVLFELYKKQENIVSRKELIRKCWKDRMGKDERVVDTVIKQLRKKLKNTTYQIQGIYGQGYLLKER